MNFSLAGVRWLRVLSVATSVIALSFIVLMVITAGYALVLAFEARGAPDQNAISRFAAQLSPRAMPWLECLWALVLSFRVGRKSREGSTVQGLLVGMLAGILGLAIALAFRGHVSSTGLLYSVGIAAAGLIGGFAGEKWPVGK